MTSDYKIEISDRGHTMTWEVWFTKDQAEWGREMLLAMQRGLRDQDYGCTLTEVSQMEVEIR